LDHRNNEINVGANQTFSKIGFLNLKTFRLAAISHKTLKLFSAGKKLLP